jgi:hypothetical protein
MGVVFTSDITPGHHLVNVDVETTVGRQEVVEVSVSATTRARRVALPIFFRETARSETRRAEAAPAQRARLIDAVTSGLGTRSLVT